MKSLSPFQSAIAWLCLICFGISTILSGALVFCTDSQGTRLELECRKTAAGECVAGVVLAQVTQTDAAGFSAGGTNPCVEQPAKIDLDQMTVATGQPLASDLLPPHVFIAALIGWAPVRETARVQPVQVDHQRPPDAVEHLGTVVLLV